MPATTTIPPSLHLSEGAPVEVRCRYDGQWTDGFIVDSAADRGYRLRRLLDGQILPSLFSDDELRPA
jgi:hypothetical protein